MKKTLLGFTAAAMMALTGNASAYPDQPVSFVVPWPPGDLEDVLTRMIADEFQATYDVPAAVVNKPGGGGGPFPGAMEVANAPADGSMVGSFVIGVPVVGPRIGIDGLNEDTFEPLGIFLTYPFILAAAGDAPFNNMQELAEHAKNNKLALGHFGAPLVPTQVTLAAAKEMGFEWGSDAAFDNVDCNTLASGDADVVNTTIGLIQPCLDKIKVLAAFTGERISKVPDAPTMGEVIPSLKISLWNGLFVKKGTPQDVKDKIIAVARKAVNSDKAKKLSVDTGAQIYWMDAADAAKQIDTDRATTLRIQELIQ